MKKTQIDAERLADEMLMCFGKALGESRADFCEALMDPDREDPPMFTDDADWRFLDEIPDSERVPDEDDDWELPPAARKGPEDDWDDDDWELPPAAKKPEGEWKQVSTDSRRSKGKRRLRRALILVAVLVLAMGLMMVAAEGVKLKKNTMHMRETPGESTFLIDSDQAFYDVEDFVVTYVPEGYELVSDVMPNEFLREIGYFNEAGEGIWIKISKTENFGANVDNECAGRTEVLVNDKQAYLFDDGTAKFLIWQMGDCTIDINGNISDEELKTIAKNIFID